MHSAATKVPALPTDTTLLSLAENPQQQQRVPRRAWLAYAVICVVWGTTFLAIRVAIETIPTLYVNAIRFIGAGSILLLLSLIVRARFPKGLADWRNTIINGVLMSAISNTLVVYSENFLASGLAALLAAMIPIWMAVLESIIGEAPMNRRKFAGLALGFAGVALLVAPAIGKPDTSLKFFLAVFLMQVNAIIWNIGTLRSKRYKSAADPMAMASIQMLSGGLAVFTLSLILGHHAPMHFSTRSLLAVLYLMIFGSVIAYSAYIYALGKLPAGKLSSYAYVNPAVAVVVGWMFLSEPLTLRMILAMAVILGGVALIQLDKRRATVVVKETR